MSAPRYMGEFGGDEGERWVSDCRALGRLLARLPLNGSDHNYVAVWEMNGDTGDSTVIEYDFGKVRVWLLAHPEPALAFALTKNGWGMVLSGTYAVR